MDAQTVINIINAGDYTCYGLRKDDFDYDMGNVCNISHELYQDPAYDDNDDLVYPYCEDGPYKGYYDAGELNGTSAINISQECSIKELQTLIENMEMYLGDNLYLVGGDYAECGNDQDEVIIQNATVLLKA